MPGKKKLSSILILVLLIGGSYAGKPVAAASGERYFPQTGHAINGAFQAYWEQHGGLERFGYPLSDEIAEVSDLNGQTYTVQYFERAEFEHHPENAAPYDVLLTQLGTLWYKQRYPVSPQSDAYTTGGQFFSETGKNVSNDMLPTWQRLGGLLQIGYPISNEFFETSELNGKSYKVQYFERAEFEYHDEQDPPVVMLTLLGRFRYNEKNVVQDSAPYLIGSNSRYVTEVAAGGHYIFWLGENERASSDECRDGCVYGYDFATRRAFAAYGTDLLLTGLTTDGTWVAWRLVGIYDYGVWAYNIGDVNTDDKSRLADPYVGLPKEDGQIGNFTIAGGSLYYEEYDKTHNGLYAYNMATKSEQLISANGKDPQASDRSLIWSETDASGVVSLHLLTAGDTAGAKIVAQGSKGTFLGYKVSASKAAWITSSPSGGVNINLYDIPTATNVVIPTTNMGEWVMSDSKMAWVVPQDQMPGSAGAAINTYDISSGVTSTVLKDVVGELHLSSIIGQGDLVFSTANNVYLLNLDAAAATGGDILEPAPAPTDTP